jgi:hypothetical protein
VRARGTQPRRRIGAIEHAKNSEIEHLDPHAGRYPLQEQIRRFQIAMHDPQAVRFRDRFTRLQQVIDRLGQRQLLFALAQLRQILALQVLHDDEGLPVFQRARIENANHVVTLDPDGGSRLADQTRCQLRRIGVLTAHQLDRHSLLQLHVLRRKHHAHAPFAQHGLEPIFAQKQATDRRNGERGTEVHSAVLFRVSMPLKAASPGDLPIGRSRRARGTTRLR